MTQVPSLMNHGKRTCLNSCLHRVCHASNRLQAWPLPPASGSSRLRGAASWTSPWANRTSTPPNTSRQQPSRPSAGARPSTPPSPGPRPCRKPSCSHWKLNTGQHYSANEITIGGGAKQVIFTAFMASLDDGDEVVIPAPYWVSYPDMVLANEGKPVIVPCGEDSGFKLTPEALARGNHRPHQMAHPEHPVQPHRSGLFTRRTAGAGRRPG